MTAIAFADYCVIVIQPVYDAATLSWLGFYNAIAALALWSLLSTYLADPGYVPRDCKYDLNKMPRLVASMYQQTSRYQSAKIDISECQGSFSKYAE